MNIIFCLSHLSVQKTIKIVKESDDDFLVITGRDSIQKFLIRLFPQEKVILLCPPVLSKKPLKIIPSILKFYFYKYKIWQDFHGYKYANVYFFHIAFGEFYLWLIKKLSVKNNVIFQPDVSFDHLDEDVSYSARMGFWLRKILYSITVKPLKSARTTIYFSVSNHFLNEIKAKIINSPILNTDSNEILDLVNIEKRKILILCGGFVGEFCTESDYVYTMDLIITYLIKKYGHDEITIKAHPKHTNYYSEENSLDKVPPEIPASMIVGMFDVVIGYCSATFIDAANANINSISLLNLIQPVDKKVKLEMIQYLNENTQKTVRYPETLEEFSKFV